MDQHYKAKRRQAEADLEVMSIQQRPGAVPRSQIAED